MLTIYKDRLIHIEWTIYKGTSSVREDFTRALVKCFLIGPREKYLVNATAQSGTLYIELPQGLEEGAYSIEAIYVKNQGNLTPRCEPLSPCNAPDYRRTPYPPFKPHDARYNDRCIMRSRRDCLFAITEYEQEEEGVPTASSGEVTLRFSTSTSSYGYDGLSAYEIAVMRGDFNGSEKEFIEASLKLGIATSERLGGIKAEEKTDNETEEAKIDPVTGKLYVPSGKANVEIATSEKVGGIKAEQKTSRETVEAKIDPKTGKLYVQPIGEGSVTYNFTNFPDDEDLTEETRENEEKVMKLADKEYNEARFSGLGRVYLRKNELDSKNVLTQEMINRAKTRYIIQYDYDLNGKEITLPEGCVLQFEGGYFKNGTINGNNSKIESLSTKIFDKTIILKNFDYVKSEWIGITPNIDCSEEFEHFTQFGLKILFSAGTYRFTISNLLLSKFTELVGEKSNESVIFVLTPKSEYEYLIGVNYFCTIRNIKIVYSNVEGIEKGIVLLVSNKFNSDIDENVESYYRYNIDNVRVEGVFRSDYDYSEDGITAFAVKCNQYDTDGSVIKSKSISWFPRVNRFKVKFAKIGVLIQTKQDSGQKYWCNSLLFTNIDINAKYGFYFDRENIYSSGWCVINNYLFQSTNKINSFGLYGYFNHDRVSNYLSWDNTYLGCGRGFIYLDKTSMQTSNFEFEEESNPTNGFLPLDGYSTTVNQVMNNKFYYPTNNYRPTSGAPVHVVDYSGENERIWRPNKTGGSAVRGVKEKITEVSSGLITYNKDILDRFEKTIFQEEISNDVEDYLPTRKTIAYNSKNGYKCLLESCGIPSYAFSVSQFKENYGFISKVFSNTINLQYNYKLTISFTSDNDLSEYKIIIKELSTFGLNIYKTLFSESSKSLILYVQPINTYNSDTVQLYITYRLRPYASSDDTNLIEADCTISYEQLNQFKGTTGQRPADNLEKGDTYYNTDTLTEEVYDGTKWINPDGYVVGARRGTTSARPSLSITDSGYEYYDTELKKKILWNGNEWVNVDGTSLISTE